MSQFKPLGSRVCLKKWEKEADDSNIIILPECFKEETTIYEVVSIGNGVEFPVKEGDRVIIDRYAGTPFLHEEKSFLIVSLDQIVAML